MEKIDKLFGFNLQRINRKSYFFTSLIANLVIFANYVFIETGTDPLGSEILAILLLLLGIVSWVVLISITARRFHDLDKSAWWLLGLLVPVLGFALAIYLLLKRGTEGPNRWGDPVEGTYLFGKRIS